jgi:hypothetical protein
LAVVRAFDRRANLEATRDYFANKITPRKPYPTAPGIKALLDLAAKERTDAARIAPERIVSLLKELDESGYVDRLINRGSDTVQGSDVQGSRFRSEQREYATG